MSDAFASASVRRIEPDGSVSDALEWHQSIGGNPLIGEIDTVPRGPLLGNRMTLSVFGGHGNDAIMLSVDEGEVKLLDNLGNSDFVQKTDVPEYVPIELFPAWQAYGGDFPDPAYAVTNGICRLRGTAYAPGAIPLPIDIGAVPKALNLETEAFQVPGIDPQTIVTIVDDPAGVGAFLRLNTANTDPETIVHFSGVIYPVEPT